MGATNLENDIIARDTDIDQVPVPVQDVEIGEGKNQNNSSVREDLDEDGNPYPPFTKVIVILIALYLALFIVALDRTIIATAIPRMTDDFHSFGDIGWYASAYLITGCAFQLIYGRIYTFYSIKWVFIATIGLFELGSLICGVAPNSTSFIIGRAIAGLGSGGIFSGSIMLMIPMVPLRKRPIYQGFMGVMFAIASVVGPLLGGVFTDTATWRWCFYINLPIGALACLIIVLFVHLSEKEKQNPSIAEQVKQLDPIGTIFFLPSIVCLLLALQWGGSTYAWSSTRMIVLIVLFTILMLAFVCVQICLQDSATVPPRIVAYRSIWASTLFAFCISGSLTIMVYYLPIWFQAIQAVSAIESGIRTLPLILALVVASIIAGGLVGKMGYFTPLMVACSIIISIACGLLTTWKVDTSKGVWIGCQVIFGFGMGLGQQQAGLAAQAVLSKEDVAIGINLKFFGQTLGGALFVAVAQNVLNNRLIQNLAALDSLGLNADVIVKTGATDLREAVPAQFLDEVLSGYNGALTDVFKVAVAVSCLSLVGACLTEWKNVKGLRGGAKGGL